MKELFSYSEQSIEGRKALITGASSGIGFATACLLASKGVKIYAVARREEKLQELARLIKEHSKSECHFLVGNITDSSFVETMRANKFFDVDILVNNAGLAIGKDEVANSDVNDWKLMIDTNITAAFRMIREALVFMKKHGGDIVNVASIAGHESYAHGAVYCASKHALLSFAEALRKETYGQDIRVMNLSPGMVQTEFSQVRFKGDKSKADSVYKGMNPLTPNDMAAHIAYMLTRPRHVCVDEILTLATDQGSATTVFRRG